MNAGAAARLVLRPQLLEEQLEAALDAALEAGYRHIDTATVYRNEHIIGKVLRRWLQSGKVRREDLFITTKVRLGEVRLVRLARSD